MKTPFGLYAGRDWDDATHFDADFDALVDKARLVLFRNEARP